MGRWGDGVDKRFEFGVKTWKATDPPTLTCRARRARAPSRQATRLAQREFRRAGGGPGTKDE